jgi:3-methyladenine DNA glycosylase/8-oxoguanine DNA glycosylase
MRFELDAVPPFSLPAVIHSHGWARLVPFNLDAEEEQLSYTYQLRNKRVVNLSFEEIPNGVAVKLNESLNKEAQREISAIVTWMLGLDQDFSEFYELARQEPKLKQVQEKAQGRLLRSPTLFEDTVKTILTTNTAWSGTIRMTQALVSQFGEPHPGDSNQHAFPTAERIAASDEHTLRGTTRLGYRSPYILNLAQDIQSGKLDLESLKKTSLPTDQLRKELLSIKGVGNYAAANLLMLLGHYSYLAIDSWAIKMVSHEWYDDRTIGPSEVENAFEKWGEWKGLAYWLWDWSYGAE